MNRAAATGTLMVVLGALWACKKDPPEETELPTPLATEPAEASVMEPTVPTAETPAAPEATVATPTPAPGAAPKATATTTATTKPTTSAPSATPTATGPSQACLSKCQAALATCLTPTPVEGGLPKMPDPTACQTAFSDCQTACQQK
jgi:hypothetical protein